MKTASGRHSSFGRSLKVQRSRHGRGVFAQREFYPGKKILEFKGQKFLYDEIEDGSYIDEHCIQIGERVYIGPSGGVDDFVNHSCNPNAGIKQEGKNFFLVAVNHIQKGEEIVWDYSTTMDEGRWELKCRCGSQNCRKKIGDFKTLPPDVKKIYVILKVMPPFLLKKYGL